MNVIMKDIIMNCDFQWELCVIFNLKCYINEETTMMYECETNIGDNDDASTDPSFLNELAADIFLPFQLATRDNCNDDRTGKKVKKGRTRVCSRESHVEDSTGTEEDNECLSNNDEDDVSKPLMNDNIETNSKTLTMITTDILCQAAETM
jgi:hypothetical protein